MDKPVKVGDYVRAEVYFEIEVIDSENRFACGRGVKVPLVCCKPFTPERDYEKSLASAD